MTRKAKMVSRNKRVRFVGDQSPAKGGSTFDFCGDDCIYALDAESTSPLKPKAGLNGAPSSFHRFISHFCGDQEIPTRIVDGIAASLRGTDALTMPGVIRRVDVGFEFAAIGAEARQVNQADALEEKLERGGEDSEAVFHTAAKVDGRGFFEIFRGAGNFTDAKAEVDTLGEHLVIEYEVVGIFDEWKLGKHFAAEGAISRVIFGELDAQK